MAPESAEREAAWHAILDALERTANSTGLLDDAATPVAWSPPRNADPIPPELLGRARAVLAAQLAAAEYLQGRLDSTTRHLAALRSVPRDDLGAVYLDVTG